MKTLRRAKHLMAAFAAMLISISLSGQDNRLFHIGADASVDCFESVNNTVAPSFGLGVRARIGRYDQWLNLVGGLRYIYGSRLSGPQIPILLNVNLLRGRTVSAYLGAGYEFDFIGTYWGCMKFQAGVAVKHFDFRIFYKSYQGDLGAGLTYYF
ncbi:MAG: hypothetical protein J5640_06160 [Bacteroidales bacterium]|nr:hypothetical protein [Bacteroidales bacterium]